MSEAPRYMARRSQEGYVSTPSQGMIGEPEAVTEDEQRALTELSRRRVTDERIKRRQATADEISRELTWAEARCRYLRRELTRLRRK